MEWGKNKNGMQFLNNIKSVGEEHEGKSIKSGSALKFHLRGLWSKWVESTNPNLFQNSSDWALNVVWIEPKKVLSGLYH